MPKIVSLIIILLSLASIATSAQVFLNSSQDAGVYEYYPNNNYGSLDYSSIGRWLDTWENTLIQFDLSSYMGAIVESAYLRLYVEGNSGDFPPNIFNTINSSAWDESTVTWSNKPAMDDWEFDLTPPSGVGTWWVVDVSSKVQNWLNGTSNYGFQLGQDTPTGSNGFHVNTKECSNPDYRPKLELNYHYAAIQSTSLGSIKTLFE